MTHGRFHAPPGALVPPLSDLSLVEEGMSRA
jgi:hypothetical protein